ncbi:hypothetical protein K9L63_00895 [Candidatus Gracilibacteria bacterium]|nr:hypothetical protein [Candidatus Gracilibacteria bacterium]
MNPQKLSESVLKKIQKENITPTGRWYFIFKNIGFWAVFNLSVLLGAVGVSVIIFAVLETDFDLFSHLRGSGWSLWLSLLPIFWLIFFVTFSGVALWGMQHTRKGYRIPTFRLLGLNLILSIVLGFVFYNVGGAEKFETIFAENVPLYKSFHQRRNTRWMHPEEGRLAGEILELRKNKILILNSFDRSTWTVDYGTSVIHIPFELQKGHKIRVLGTQTGKKDFQAKTIDLWRPPRKMPFWGREEREFFPRERKPPRDGREKSL